jgi:hypothetical protein
MAIDTPSSARASSDSKGLAMSALPPKADMCSATRYVRFVPKADIRGAFSISDEQSGAGQDNPDFGELAELCIDLDGARVLFHDDIVADGEAKTRAFSGRFGREKRVEHLFSHVRRHTGAVIVNSDFHTIAKILGRGRESRLVVATIDLCSAPGRSIEAVCNEIKKSPPDVLRENVCPTSRRIKGLLELDLKTLRLGPRSMPGKIKAFLNESIDINHPMLT